MRGYFLPRVKKYVHTHTPGINRINECSEDRQYGQVYKMIQNYQNRLQNVAVLVLIVVIGLNYMNFELEFQNQKFNVYPY